MDRKAGFALRWARALLLACVSVAGGALGHVSADGLLPGVGGLAALFLVATCAAAAMLGRPASTLRVVLLLVVGQTLIHVALAAMAGHHGDSAGPPELSAHRPAMPDLADAGARVGFLHDHLHPDPPVHEHLAVLGSMQHVFAELTSANALMALAHLAAAAAVGLWLALGERALWTVLALTGQQVQVLVRAAIGSHLEGCQTLSELACRQRPDPVPGNAVLANQEAPRLLLLSRAVVRRGPPPLLTA
jgi:hypothetical protein